MPKEQESSDQFRSFTVRVPLATYLEMCRLAQEEGSNLNQKVNQLVRLGLGKHVSLDRALRKLLAGTVAKGDGE